MSQHLQNYLSTLKATQLRHLAHLTSVHTHGTKPALLSRLTSSLPQPLLSHPTAKILSIDLGLRNLGICLASLTYNPTPQLHVNRWSRLTLIPSQSPSSSSSKRKEEKEKVNHLFQPPQLAPLAHNLVTQTFLTRHPTTLLLERQRHRSAGAAAVLEWTLRVGALEAMVWAVLETLKHQRQKPAFPACWAVEPGQVARFWVNGWADGKGAVLDELERGVETKVKMGVKKRAAGDVKKEKVALVRRWLGNEGAAPFKLSFAKEAAEVRDRLLMPVRGRGTRVSGKEEDKVGKLDDIADCFLQAVTWVQWDWNRRRVVHEIESRAKG